ncbi:MAG: phosphotransferase [Chromatiales bacterium]|nr:phosphotransferase [Chromatiales bacterium]
MPAILEPFIDRAYFARYGIAPESLFERLWQHDSDWVEPPNKRRGGWSGVYRLHLKGHAGSPADTLYVKVQHEHYTSSFLGIGREPTLNREKRMLGNAAQAGVHVPECVFFEIRGAEALIATRELKGFVALDEIQRQFECGALSRADLRRLTNAAAQQLAILHAARIQHNKPSDQHVMANPHTGEVAIIDWEMARFGIRRGYTMLRDVGILARNTLWVSPRERASFLRRYLGIERLDARAKILFRRLAARVERKVNASEARRQRRRSAG